MDVKILQRYPHVLNALLERGEHDKWTLFATISSAYDSPSRYADAFRASTPSGKELGVRALLHDHANEQPFTRLLSGLKIPPAVDQIVVEARDKEHGWGGSAVTIDVPRE